MILDFIMGPPYNSKSNTDYFSPHISAGRLGTDLNTPFRSFGAVHSGIDTDTTDINVPIKFRIQVMKWTTCGFWYKMPDI